MKLLHAIHDYLFGLRHRRSSSSGNHIHMFSSALNTFREMVPGFGGQVNEGSSVDVSSNEVRSLTYRKIDGLADAMKNVRSDKDIQMMVSEVARVGRENHADLSRCGYEHAHEMPAERYVRGAPGHLSWKDFFDNLESNVACLENVPERRKILCDNLIRGFEGLIRMEVQAETPFVTCEGEKCAFEPERKSGFPEYSELRKFNIALFENLIKHAVQKKDAQELKEVRSRMSGFIKSSLDRVDWSVRSEFVRLSEKLKTENSPEDFEGLKQSTEQAFIALNRLP